MVQREFPTELAANIDTTALRYRTWVDGAHIAIEKLRKE